MGGKLFPLSAASAVIVAALAAGCLGPQPQSFRSPQPLSDVTSDQLIALFGPNPQVVPLSTLESLNRKSYSDRRGNIDVPFFDSMRDELIARFKRGDTNVVRFITALESTPKNDLDQYLSAAGRSILRSTSDLRIETGADIDMEDVIAAFNRTPLYFDYVSGNVIGNSILQNCIYYPSAFIRASQAMKAKTDISLFKENFARFIVKGNASLTLEMLTSDDCAAFIQSLPDIHDSESEIASLSLIVAVTALSDLVFHSGTAASAEKLETLWAPVLHSTNSLEQVSRYCATDKGLDVSSWRWKAMLAYATQRAEYPLSLEWIAEDMLSRAKEDNPEYYNKLLARWRLMPVTIPDGFKFVQVVVARPTVQKRQSTHDDDIFDMLGRPDGLRINLLPEPSSASTSWYIRKVYMLKDNWSQSYNSKLLFATMGTSGKNLDSLPASGGTFYVPLDWDLRKYLKHLPDGDWLALTLSSDGTSLQKMRFEHPEIVPLVFIR